MAKKKDLIQKQKSTAPDEPPLKLEGIIPTPFDKFPVKRKCFYIIGVKYGCYIMLFCSFLWIMEELVANGSFLTRIIPKNHDAFKYLKYSYFGVLVVFGGGCISLLYGIYLSRYKPITVFVWMCLIFIIIYLTLTIVGVGFAMNDDLLTKRTLIKLTLVPVWFIFYGYLLLVVNSYRIILFNTPEHTAATTSK